MKRCLDQLAISRNGDILSIADNKSITIFRDVNVALKNLCLPVKIMTREKELDNHAVWCSNITDGLNHGL